MDEEASSKKSPNTNDEEMDTQEQILKRLMRISKTKLSKLFQYKEKLVEEAKKKKSIVNQECQTDSIAHEQSLLNNKTSEQKDKPELKKLDAEKRLFHENNDSGLSIAGDVEPMYYHRMATTLRSQNQNFPSNFNVQQSVYRVSNEERNSPGSHGVNRPHYIRPSSSDHYSKDFVDYVEFMKNREIEAYKEVR